MLSVLAGLADRSSLAELVRRLGKDPLGHAPDDALPRAGRLGPGGSAGDLEPHRVVSIRSQQVVEGHPVGRGHPALSTRAGRAGRRNDEGTNRYRREHRSAGDHVVEAARRVARVKRGSRPPHRSPGWRWQPGPDRQAPGGRPAAPCGQTRDLRPARPGESGGWRRDRGARTTATAAQIRTGSSAVVGLAVGQALLRSRASRRG